MKRRKKKPNRLASTRGRKSNRVIAGVGPACSRCGEPTEVREHGEVTAKMLRQPFYFSRWYYCRNRECRTTLIMPDEFKVFPLSKERLRPGDDIVMDVLNGR